MRCPGLTSRFNPSIRGRLLICLLYTSREALNKECADATKLVVAQRIGTIRDADRIIVLDEGKTAGIGTHEELMQNCEVYRQIAFSQLSKEELA